MHADGICDDVDDVGQLDDCGICNGPGAIYDCSCSDIPAGGDFYDCDGNQLDALGVLPAAGDARLTSMETASATSTTYRTGLSGCLRLRGVPAGDCDCDGNQLDALGVCGGAPADTDRLR